MSPNATANMTVVNGVTPSAVQILDKFLEAHPTVKLINIQVVDICGSLRLRVVPVQAFRKTLQGDGIHPGSGSVADLVCPPDNAIIFEILPYIIPKGYLKYETSTLRMCHDSANLRNTASVMCSIDLMDMDARTLLKRTVADAEAHHKLNFLVGHELEFYFMELDRKTGPREGDKGLHNSAILNRSRYWPVLNEIVVALAEEGIYVIELHKEYAPHQFEIALPPYDPVESVDILVYTRGLIRDIAYRHNLVATFYPEPVPKSWGEDYHHNGAHIHISANCSENNNTSFEPDQFLGGLLSHTPALCAIGHSSVDSYGRIEHGGFGAGSFVSWGTNNRSTSVRLVSKNHWEVRFNDGCSNPYLMLMGIISAGLDFKPLTLKEIKRKFANFALFDS